MTLLTPSGAMRAVMGALLYFPSREITQAPDQAGLEFVELGIDTEDGETLHGWWVRAAHPPASGHILLFHGNAGNIGDRVEHAGLLARAGFDVLLFDYRGYGLSTGAPDEEGTYRDGRAAQQAMLARPDCDPRRVVYLGESLGGAVAVKVALAAPPRALILQSTFTSLRGAARWHYPLIPRFLVPDAYPTISRVGSIRAPVLVIHGDRDAIVPVAHGRALFDAAPQPKRLCVFDGLGHNDIISAEGQYARVVAEWVSQAAGG